MPSSPGVTTSTPSLDLPYQEDSRAQVDLNCVMNELGEIIEIQGTGEGRAFSLKEQQELVELCARRSPRRYGYRRRPAVRRSRW